jgi:low affinity Fe/Cu permease
MHERFHRFAWRVSERMGSPHAFLAAFGVVLAWALTGPMFHFTDAWQLVINTGTTIVTFLMVFLIQATQNRDGRATQLKLDELIRSQKRARNVFADLEHATDEELQEFEREFVKLRARAAARQAAKAERPAAAGTGATAEPPEGPAAGARR